MRKWPSGVLHDQEWERFESSVCLQFHEQTMYSQITDKALSFQTMISPDPRNAPNYYQHARALFHQDPPGLQRFWYAVTVYNIFIILLLTHYQVPIYDARRIVVNFNTDLGRLGEVLPLFPGEVPVGSYTVVGYALSSYMATLSGSSDRVPHVGCNILWAIVCGTPSVASRT
ncbi:hypothetical protein C8R46DRAFT_897499 [Mycena filopes]|nr:hypothetical protein C8R46DRAFT_912267 [Mycena filopes]KAJ7168837.1 hypothetical protein C8R46DRAFT_897499 [Mycena filopes]